MRDIMRRSRQVAAQKMDHKIYTAWLDALNRIQALVRNLSSTIRVDHFHVRHAQRNRMNVPLELRVSEVTKTMNRVLNNGADICSALAHLTEDINVELRRASFGLPKSGHGKQSELWHNVMKTSTHQRRKQLNADYDKIHESYQNIYCRGYDHLSICLSDETSLIADKMHHKEVRIIKK